MINIFNYIERKSPIHNATGATKLILFLLWSFAAMITYDTRVLLVLPVISVALFAVSKIRLSDVRVMLIATCIFMLLNNILVFLFSPQHGCEIYGSRTVLFTIGGPYVVTKEQLFYHLNLFLKYLAQVPMILLFVSTTQPSEFAASLNRIGVSYKISYAVALALRYIPGLQSDYVDISRSQQARGVEMSKKETLFKRLKAAGTIIIPLILSSMDRIDTISNAMELRGFGKGEKRSWYMARRFGKIDFFLIGLGLMLLAVVIILFFVNGGRYYNPFV